MNKFRRTWPAIALGLAMAGTTGCAALGLGGTETVDIGDTVTLPAGRGETEATMEVSVTSLEKAPDKVLKKLEDGGEAWFAEMTFQRGDKELEKYDSPTPWLKVYGFLEDETVIELVGGVEKLGGCGIEGTDAGALQEAYIAGEKLEVCLPVFGDGSSPLAGVFLGSTSEIEAGTAWVK